MQRQNMRVIFSLCACTLFLSISYAQQYNSDSWISKKHGTVTIIPTFGERNSMIMNTYSLFPRWEFTMAAYWYNNDANSLTDDGYSTTFYMKYMFFENSAQTGGAAVKVGTGTFPGTALEGEDRQYDALKTFWMNVPITIPLLNNKISWDIMPGAMVTKDYQLEGTVWSYTYSTRVAWYAFNPELGVVGEIFGAGGEGTSLPEYKIGLRWEPTLSATFALTYGQEINGDNGAGLEFGIMLFTPPFACFKKCR